MLESKQNKSEVIQEQEKSDIDELQRQGQEELMDLKSSPYLELKHRGKGDTQVDISALKGEDSSAQDHGPQQDGAQEQVQGDRQNKEAKEDRLYKAEAQENGANEIRAEERGQEHRVQEDGQEDGAHEAGAHEAGAHEAGQRNDMAQGGSQADGAQEAGQDDKAHKSRQDDGAYEYRAAKRRVVTEESEDGGALRAQQVREGRKPVEKGKYQQLNRFRPLSHDMNWQGDTSIDGTGEGDTTPMPKKKPQTLRRQQRQDQQTQQRVKKASAAATTGNTNSSTGLTSDFTYEAQQASSRGT